MNIAPGSHNQRFLAALDAKGYVRPPHIIESDAFGVMWNLTMRSDALIVCLPPCSKPAMHLISAVFE